MPPNPNQKKKKILWIEDDIVIGTVLSTRLTAAGFDLTYVKNGEDAMSSLAKDTPDAIILDLILPGMSGFDVLQKINDDTKLKKIPVMILSNLSKPVDWERTRKLGAKNFLVKAATSLDKVVEEAKQLCETEWL